MNVPKSHPRYISLKIRTRIELGVREGITSLNGLIAQGRGEAFDYLIGEKTNRFAVSSLEAAAALLMLAKHPVISVNGNTAALVSKELIAMSKILNAPLEVNLFHKSQERLIKIKNHLIKNGAKEILLPDERCIIPFLDSDRRYVNPTGIMKADVVFVPLEDGDRTEALIKNGKKVITVDLNPLSRTAQKATITIVDNIVRALPTLISIVKNYKSDKVKLKLIIQKYNNRIVLVEAIQFIAKRFAA